MTAQKTACLAILLLTCFKAAAAEEIEWNVVDGFGDENSRWIICRSGDTQALFYGETGPAMEYAARQGGPDMKALFTDVDRGVNLGSRWLVYSKPLDQIQTMDVLFEGKKSLAIPYTEILRVRARR